jgi:hypothetical protein
MTVTTRRLALAALDTPVMDATDRNIMPMGTLIASEMWLIEVPWDGARIGDAQVFINRACNPGNGAKEPGADDRWEWWTGVPASRIKNYRFLDTDRPSPQTLKNAERQEKPGKAPRADQQAPAPGVAG